MMAALVRRLRSKDPDLINLRKAGRAVLLLPPIYAGLTWAFGDTTIGLFGFFAGFVFLVIADLGGPFMGRALACLALLVLGDLTIAIATLLTDSPIGGALGMFVLVFLASFARVYGGYAPAFLAPLALAYSLSVLDPLWSVDMFDRLLGWSLGSAIATIGALVLWPVSLRSQLRAKQAVVAADLAAALSSSRDADAARGHLKRAVDTLGDVGMKAAMPMGPGSLSSRDLGLLHLVDDLDYAADITQKVLDQGIGADDEPLAAATAQAFGETENVLLGEGQPGDSAPDITALDKARLANQKQEIDDVLRAYERGADDPTDRFRRSFLLRALSHVALWVEARAAEAAGAAGRIHPVASAPEIDPMSDRPAAMLRRAFDTAVTHFRPSGVTFQNSIRAAAAMTLAVVAAEHVPLAHGFWITLGTLVILRSSASSTSTTALQAVAGTFIGFCVAAAVLLLLGESRLALWTLLPVAIFLAAYAPGVAGFVLGQVSLTSLFVILFTLVSPAGISTDIIRLETVSLGAVAAAITALLLWPRGARAVLAVTLARLYRSAANAINLFMTSAPAERDAACQQLMAERRRADAAFGIALGERGEHIDALAWIAVLRAPGIVEALLAGLMQGLPERAEGQLGDAADAMRRRRAELAAALSRAANRLDPQQSQGGPAPSHAKASDTPTALRRCLKSAERWNEELVSDAAVLASGDMWLSLLADEIQRAEPALDTVVSASRPGSWLRWSLPRFYAPAPAK